MSRTKVALLVILAALPLAAQGTREVDGIVRDQHGRPLAGAVVRMKNLSTGQVWSNLTRSDGSYRFQKVNFDQSFRLQADYRNNPGNVRHLSEYDWRPSAVINLRVDIDWWAARRR